MSWRINSAAGTLASLLAIILALSYSGPYRWLAEWQLDHLGQYAVVLTALLTGLLLYLPLLGIMRLVSFTRLGAWLALRQGAPDARSRAATPQKSPWACDSDNDRRRAGIVTQLTYLAIFVGIGLIVDGILDRVQAAGMNHRCSMTIEQLQSGLQPTSDWITLTGWALPDQASGLSADGVTARFYVPIVPSTGTAAGGAVAYLSVLERAMGSIDRARPGRHEGVISRLGLPGPVRVDLAEHGYGPAPSYCVIDLGVTPTIASSRSSLLVRCGTYVLAAGVGLALLRFYSSRRWS